MTCRLLVAALIEMQQNLKLCDWLFDGCLLKQCIVGLVVAFSVVLLTYELFQHSCFLFVGLIIQQERFMSNTKFEKIFTSGRLAAPKINPAHSGCCTEGCVGAASPSCAENGGWR